MLAFRNSILGVFGTYTLITRATEHFRSSPWSYNIANVLPHLLKGMNLYIVELSYTVFNETVIIFVTFFDKKVTFFDKKQLFLYDVLEVPRGLGRSGKVSKRL